MTKAQTLLALYNERLHAYNTALDEKIAATSKGAERRRLDARKFAPLSEGEVGEDELRRRLRVQRLCLGIVLKTRAIELLRHTEPELHLCRYTAGLSYAQIIEMLRQEFPEAKVSSACLRWYVGKVTEEVRDTGTGKTGLPQWRPRSEDSRSDELRARRNAEHDEPRTRQRAPKHWRKVRAERRAAQAALQDNA